MNKSRLCVFVIIAFLYTCTLILFTWGITERRKWENMKEYRCYVTTVNINQQQGTIFYHWNVTIMDKNERFNDIHITSVIMPENQSAELNLSQFKVWKSIFAVLLKRFNNFQINKTYPCYNFQSSWQWNKPSNPKRHRLLFLAANLLVFPGICLQIFGRCFYQKGIATHSRYLTTVLPNYSVELPIVFAETSPPTYEEAMRERITRSTVV